MINVFGGVRLDRMDMKLWMPIDTLVFYWNERTSTGAHVYPTPLEEVIADLDHLCNENDGWTFLRRDMNNYQRTYQYKSQEAGQDVRKIGRASCRERGAITVCAVSV